MEKSKLETALSLAERGFRVFPLESSDRLKVPAIVGWQKRATTDSDQVRQFWTCPITGFQVDRDIGIATGEGLVVIDVDVKDGKRGEETMQALTLAYDDLPPTAEAKTKSGGRHLYFRTDRDLGIGTSSLGKDVDHRGEGGFVKFHSNDAAVLAAPMAELPDWAADLLQRNRRVCSDAAAVPAVDLDTPVAVQRALSYLTTHAPQAVQGAAGDETTYRVACAVRDFAISEPMCLELLLDHWNEHQAPPWSLDELSRKVGNAYQYAKNPAGVLSPDYDFPVPASAAAASAGANASSPALPRLTLAPYQRAVTEAIPPRPWVLKDVLLAGGVTMLIAPGGAGKSTLSLALAAAVAAGRDDIAGIPVRRAGRVAVFNNEDERDELLRRMRALEDVHGDVDVSGQVMLNSGVDRRLCVARKSKDGRIAPTEDAAALEDEIRRHDIAVLVVDPLISTYDGCDENSNYDAEGVMSVYRGIAARTGCAILVVHHTNKPQGTSDDGRAGNMNSGRGASAFKDAARIGLTLYGMAAGEAKALAVPEEDRGRYVRLDNGKANYSIKGGALWFRMESIELANGDSVGAIRPVSLHAKQDAAAEKAEAEAASLAQLAVSLVPVGEQCMSASSIARKLASAHRELGSHEKIRQRIVAAFSPPREVQGRTYEVRKMPVPGSKDADCLVRLI